MNETLETTLQNTTLSMQTARLLEVVAKYFVDNPGCLTEQYSPEDAVENDLLELEKYCSDPFHWYEVIELMEGDGESVHRVFFLRDCSVLEKHGFGDSDDAVKVYIEATSSEILEFSLECH